MSLSKGPASVARFTVLSEISEEIDFSRAAFREIETQSENIESRGFVPFVPDAEYQTGTRRWAFRVRIDTRKPDPTAVKERVAGLIAAEVEAGAEFVGPRKRKELNQLAKEELLYATSPKMSLIECAIDGNTLYVGSVSRAHLGIVMQLLRQIGVEVSPKTPWSDAGQPETDPGLVPIRDASESAHGADFLARLLGDGEIMVEPEGGSARLVTRAGRVSLSGEVRSDLYAYMASGAALLSVKLVTGSAAFKLDGPGFRISGLRIETERHEHWTDLLDERLEKIGMVFELLEAKYASLPPAEIAPPADEEVSAKALAAIAYAHSANFVDFIETNEAGAVSQWVAGQLELAFGVPLSAEVREVPTMQPFPLTSGGEDPAAVEA